LQCLGFLVGVHLSDDVDTIILFSQHHRQQYRGVERAAKTDDYSVNIEDAEMLQGLLVQGISPNCPGHVISNFLDEVIVPVYRQDIDPGAEQPGRHPKAKPAQPNNRKTLV